MSIDGHSVHGWDGDKAATQLRGKQGSTVNIRLARRTQQVPGIAGRPDPPLYTTYRQVGYVTIKLHMSTCNLDSTTALSYQTHKNVKSCRDLLQTEIATSSEFLESSAWICSEDNPLDFWEWNPIDPLQFQEFKAAAASKSWRKLSDT